MASVLSAAPFVKHQLSYRAPTATAGVYTTGTVTAFVSPYRFDHFRNLPGADTELIRGRGELVSPLSFPAGVGVGSELTLTYSGQAYVLTILTIIENDLVGVPFGAYFGFTMRLAGSP